MSPSSERSCHVVRAGGTYDGKQGFSYFEGISHQSVGSDGICMHLLTIPPGKRAKAHMHESHETAIYILSGEAVTYWGDKLQNRMVNTAWRHGLHPGRRAASADECRRCSLFCGHHPHRSERTGECGSFARAGAVCDRVRTSFLAVCGKKVCCVLTRDFSAYASSAPHRPQTRHTFPINGETETWCAGRKARSHHTPLAGMPVKRSLAKSTVTWCRLVKLRH